jgi:phosphatidylinositol phospholipase C, beta
LPSPSTFKRKILIKNKRLKPEIEKRQLELLNSGTLNEINETVDEQNAIDGEDVIEDCIKKNDYEEAHPEFNSAEEQKKVSYNLLIKKVIKI